MNFFVVPGKLALEPEAPSTAFAKENGVSVNKHVGGEGTPGWKFFGTF